MLKAEADVAATRIPVFLGVAPGEKRQVGDPDPSEEVPRIPYEIPAYRITLGEPPNLPEAMYLEIALLAVNGSEVSPANDYVPPCVGVDADDRLSATAVDYRNRLENLLKLSINAHIAASSEGHRRGASTKLQSAFRGNDALSRVSHGLSSRRFRDRPERVAPGVFIAQFKKLFRVVSALLHLQPGLKDFLNEKFFTREPAPISGRGSRRSIRSSPPPTITGISPARCG